MTNDEILDILRKNPELIPEVLAILSKHKTKDAPSSVA